MVTFITILQVNLVMSILLYVMVFMYLYGIQATNMDSASSTSSSSSSSSQKQQPSPDPLNSLIIQLLQADLTRGKPRLNQSRTRDTEIPDFQDTVPLNIPISDDSMDHQWDKEDLLDQDSMVVNSDLLRQHKRYHSPRVLISDRPPLQPPPLYLADDFVNESGNRTRKKRYAEHRSYRGEYSVCDSQSRWVTDRTEAVDDRGSLVTVLAKIRTNAREDIKQYFFETRCQSPRPSKGGCRGIDSKNWNSQCKTTQTFVRALTQVRNTVGWRWIRIDTSCVCALSRKRRRT